MFVKIANLLGQHSLMLSLSHRLVATLKERASPTIALEFPFTCQLSPQLRDMDCQLVLEPLM